MQSNEWSRTVLRCWFSWRFFLCVREPKNEIDLKYRILREFNAQSAEVGLLRRRNNNDFSMAGTYGNTVELALSLSLWLPLQKIILKTMMPKWGLALDGGGTRVH